MATKEFEELWVEMFESTLYVDENEIERRKAFLKKPKTEVRIRTDFNATYRPEYIALMDPLRSAMGKINFAIEAEYFAETKDLVTEYFHECIVMKSKWMKDFQTRSAIEYDKLQVLLQRKASKKCYDVRVDCPNCRESVSKLKLKVHMQSKKCRELTLDLE